MQHNVTGGNQTLNPLIMKTSPNSLVSVLPLVTVNDVLKKTVFNPYLPDPF